MRVIAHIAPGPSWLTGRSVAEQGEPVRAHLRFMQTHFDDGTLLLGGPGQAPDSVSSGPVMAPEPTNSTVGAPTPWHVP